MLTVEDLKFARHHLGLMRWRVKNLGPVVRARLDPALDPALASIAEELLREGIVVRQHTALFGSEGAELLSAVEGAAKRLWAESRDVATSSSPEPHKTFRIPLLPPRLPLDSPFVRLALDPSLLAVVQRYLGMRPFLRWITLWWDFPTDGPPKETQLWHQDGDDVMNAKVFLYFTDVDAACGPFCFIPRTHPRGERRRVTPAHDVKGRTTDEQMARVIPTSDWRVCTGSAGTVVICDTCGYHKGLKPSREGRLLLMLQYTSRTPRWPRVLHLTGDGAGVLSAIQRDALGKVG